MAFLMHLYCTSITFLSHFYRNNVKLLFAGTVFRQLTSPRQVPVHHCDFHTHGCLTFSDTHNGRVVQQHHVLVHTRSGLNRQPCFITAYSTLYQHASLGYQKGSTLILANFVFTSVPLKARKYGSI